MPTPLQSIAAARVSRRSLVATHIAGMIAGYRKPDDPAYALLLTQDHVGYAVEILQPGGLAKIIGHSLQGLLAYRVARHFEAVPLNAGLIDLQDLRRLKTPEARLALAALNALPWRSASPAERRVIVTANLLRRITACGVSL